MKRRPLTPGEAARLAGDVLDQIATVYDEGSGGAFDHILRGNLACHLGLLDAATPTAADRDELAARRAFFWDSVYVMPEQIVQLEVGSDGVRWNPLPGTFQVLPGPGPTAILRRCDVVRAV